MIVSQTWRWLLEVCRGDYDLLAEWIAARDARLVWHCCAVIILGCGAYGFTLGLWRSPLLGAYVAIKLPLAVFAVVLLNGLLNGMLAQLLGSGLGFRQTVMMILVSFALFGLIVGSIAPISFFAALNLPGSQLSGADQWHGATLVFHTCVIAFAGLVANLKLLRLMVSTVPNARSAVQTFFGWTLGNLFVGAQIVYVCRPFFGNPDLPVQFLRPDALAGNFYLGLWGSALNATSFNGAQLTFLALLGAGFVLHQLRRTIRQLIKESP